MFKMVKKMQNSGLEIVAGLTRPLKVLAMISLFSTLADFFWSLENLPVY